MVAASEGFGMFGVRLVVGVARPERSMGAIRLGMLFDPDRVLVMNNKTSSKVRPAPRSKIFHIDT